MQNILSRLSSFYYIDLPYHWLGWVGWALMSLVVLWIAYRSWKLFPPAKPIHWYLLLGLLTAVPLTSLFLGIQLPEEFALPLPNIPAERMVPSIMFLAALPWVLAAGFLGPLPAALLAGLSGLLIALFESHSAFTPVELAGLGLLFGMAARQCYRTPVYQFLRQPLGAALVLGLVYVPVYMLGGFFEVSGPLAVRLDWAITQTWPVYVARNAEMLLASLVAEVLVIFKIKHWPRPASREPSPSETSMQTRFFYSTLPLVSVLLFTLVVADWMVAGNAARQMVRDRLSSTAQVASESLPYFMEAGQNLILNLATPDLMTLPGGELEETLGSRLRAIPFFRQLYLFDAQGMPISGHPVRQFSQLLATPEETAAIKLALNGVSIQTYIIPPARDENTAQVSFIAMIPDEQGKPAGVLLGRTDLSSNPFTQPAIQALETMKAMDGEGMILDEGNRILYHPTSALVMNDYIGRVSSERDFYDDSSQQGTRRLVYTQPVAGRGWMIVLSVPAQQAQQLALNIAVPLLLILLVSAALIFILLRFSLRGVTATLHTLSQEATLISVGELDHPLNASGVDEVGRLGSAFEKMRVSLKARLSELKRLLEISQRVASTLDVKDAVVPILEAAMVDGASAARVVLVREVTLEAQGERPFSFGLGASAEKYAHLDETLFDLMRHQETLMIPNTTRARRLNFPIRRANPGALLAWALYHKNSYYGVFWVAYDHAHAFNDEEVRIITTLASQAAVAAANARLYATAEIGRQRLEAVLASTPEPVLVTDAEGRLLLLNPATLQVPGLVVSSTPGRPIRDVVPVQPLLDLLVAPYDCPQPSPQEITFPNGRVYYVSVSPVVAEGQPMGKVCTLRDITHYKELDALKSEFVATVSHDLRSPLTLMRGYATMLQMVGELNEQQKGYVRKINLGVENMARLVSNLLDLGRIEAGIDLQLDRFSVNETVEMVVGTMQPQAAQKNIVLKAELPDGQPVMIEADVALLQQAVQNLVENAIKYTPVGGQVTVRLLPQATGVVIEVHDTGIGVAPLDLPRLFEKFFRSGRREAYQQRGTGLGLAIVKSIAERHGGRVRVESTLGKGSVFFLEVPYEQNQPQPVQPVA